MRIGWLTYGALLLGMIAGLAVVAMNISEQDMDDAMDEAMDMWENNKQKNMQAYLKGQDDVDPHSACYKAQVFSGASKGALEINKKASLAMVALKCLLKKYGIDYKKIKDNDNFRVTWSKKIKKLCDKVQKEDVKCDRNPKYRTIDGTCNNQKHPLWGAAMMPQRRWLPPKYDDGLDSPRQTSVLGCKLPSARVVSNEVFRSKKKLPRNRQRTMMLMEWGQFLDHDLDRTPTFRGVMGAAINCCGKKGTVDERPECLPISIPKKDPFYSKFGKRSCMNFVRSLAATDHCGLEHREQLNEITAYLDASNVYGSSDDLAKMLRTEDGHGALLKYEANNHLPMGPTTSCNLQSKKDYCLKAGDKRVNESPALGAMHTLFMREHNRIATRLEKLNPKWSKEKIFQEARKIVGAFMQHISYEEYLPAFFSDKTMRKYNLKSKKKGYNDVYDPKVNPTIMNSFSTAAFRHGHSQVEDYQATMKKNFKFAQKNPIQETFMDPHMVLMDGGEGVDAMFPWLVEDPTSLADRFFGTGVRDRLFENKAGDGLDLPAINVQRGRDHGLPGYNEWRVKCGLDRAKSFKGLKKTHDKKSLKKLWKVYSDVDDIDLYAGAMSEEHLPDSFLGPTFTCILAEQFRNLKFGDRFWYETSDKRRGFTPEQLEEIKKVSLAKVICNNMDIDKVQPECLKVPNNGSNKRRPCEDLTDVDLDKWKE